MSKIPFNPNNPDMYAVREAFLMRLRRDASFNSMQFAANSFLEYVEIVESREDIGIRHFEWLVIEVFWQLLVEGILSPGLNAANPDYPRFHITKYGRDVLESEVPTPHDYSNYLERLHNNIDDVDETVEAYLIEALSTYRSNNLIASTVMLGVAAERVFLLLCEAVIPAIRDTAEKETFERIYQRFAMKPKMDWINNKFDEIRNRKMEGFPENAGVMLTAIYDLMRTQRNELGHPRENPPSLSREDVFVNLQIFPRYYETAITVQLFLKNNKI